MADSNERFFILTPTPTGRTTEPQPPINAAYSIYLDASGMEMKWSGKIPVPAIGDRIYMSVNSIGYGSVVGFAESYGFLGLLVKPEDAPDWWRKQHAAHVKEHKQALKLGPEKAAIERVRTYPQWILDGICCVFGAEVRLTKEV